MDSVTNPVRALALSNDYGPCLSTRIIYSGQPVLCADFNPGLQLGDLPWPWLVCGLLFDIP